MEKKLGKNHGETFKAKVALEGTINKRLKIIKDLSLNDNPIIN